MAKTDWKTTLNKIDQIEGLLVPGQEKVLYFLASKLRSGSVIVEIGSFMGKSTACFALGRRFDDIKIYAIDTFAGNAKDFIRGTQFKGKGFFAEFRKNLEKLGLYKNIIPVKGLSQDVGKTWNKSIDLLFIDGSHIYKDVKKDFELFFPWVKPGGLVLFHDVHPEFPGVLRVWREIARLKLSAIGNNETLYFGFKPRSVLLLLADWAQMWLLKKKIK